VVVFSSSLIPGADDAIGLEPFDRRHPELEANIEGVTGVAEYSIDQAQQLERLSPIKFCTLPEFFLYEATSEYIPKDYLEESESYDVRKTRAQSSFEPYYCHLRNLIIGTALRKGIAVPDNVDPAWGTFFEDCDLEGHSLTSYAKEAFTSAVDSGAAGIWVEYPAMPEGISAEQERLLNPRPYLVLIKCERVLECRHDIFSVNILGESLFGSFPTYLRIKGEIRRQSATNEFFEEVIPAVFVYDMVEVDEEFVSDINDTLRTIERTRKVRCRTFVKQMFPAIPTGIFKRGRKNIFHSHLYRLFPF
jgi:hypothetical protein